MWRASQLRTRAAAVSSQWTWQPCRKVGRQATSTPTQGEVAKGLSAEWLRGLSAPGWSQAVALEVLSCLLPGKIPESRAPSGDHRPQQGSLGAVASLPFPARTLEGRGEEQPPRMQSPRPGLPEKGTYSAAHRLTSHLRYPPCSF